MKKQQVGRAWLRKNRKYSYIAANHAVSSSSVFNNEANLRSIFSLAVWLNNFDTPSLLPAIQLNAKQAFLLLPASPEHNISVSFDNCKEETDWRI